MKKKSSTETALFI